MMPEPKEPDDADEALQHLLIVDDDTRIRTLLQRYLSENGYRVTAAKDAAFVKITWHSALYARRKQCSCVRSSMGWSMGAKVRESCRLQKPVNVDALLTPIN